MRRLFALALCLPLALSAACFDKSDDDDDDDDEGDGTDEPTGWGDGSDGGGSGDGADGGDGGDGGGGELTEANAARLASAAVCAWIDDCFGLEMIGMESMEACIETYGADLEDQLSTCDVDLAAVQDCIQELRASRESGDCNPDLLVACSSTDFCL